jgi:hypothetical protein
MIIKLKFFIVILIISICSCSKYDGGGLVRKSDYNLLITWRLDRVNSATEKSLQRVIEDYREEYFEDSTFIVSFKDTIGNQYVDTGLWFWTNDKRFIHYEGLDSIYFYDSSEIAILHQDVKVEKLDAEGFNYVFPQNGVVHRIQLIPN